MEKKLEDIQGKRQVLEKVLKEKNAKANNLQEEVYVLKERLANAQGTHKRELETEKQKVCYDRGFHFLGIYDSADKEGLPRVYRGKLIPVRSQGVGSLIAETSYLLQ